MSTDKNAQDIDYTENNGLVGNPITNQLMEHDRAALGAEEAGAVVASLEQPKAPEAQP